MIVPQSAPLPFSPDQLVMLEGVSDTAVGYMLGITSRTVALRRERVVAGGAKPPALDMMTPEAGLALAQRRGRAQLPWLSRAAIADYRKQGATRHELAEAFRCSVSTIDNVICRPGFRYDMLSMQKRLTHSQHRPPAAGWGKGEN